MPLHPRRLRRRGRAKHPARPLLPLLISLALALLALDGVVDCALQRAAVRAHLRLEQEVLELGRERIHDVVCGRELAQERERRALCAVGGVQERLHLCCCWRDVSVPRV